MIQTFDLCILNSWGRARALHCATYINGDVKTQIDYVLTRRTLVDRQARCAGPLALDLAPWRLGPRHRPVRASIAIQGCWRLRSVAKGNRGPEYSVQDLRTAATAGSEHWRDFAQQVRAVVQAQSAPLTIAALNRLVLPLCRRFFPSRCRAKAHAYQSVEVATAIADMWRAYHRMRSAPRHVNLKRRVFEAIRRINRFRVLCRGVRRASLSYRKQRVHALIDRAATAAGKDQMTEIYHVCKLLAPKQRKEKVCIRSANGSTLSPAEQFDAIHGYFSKAFSHPSMVGFSGTCVPPTLTQDEILSAISDLKPRKAIPSTSLPVEVWQACPDIFADCVARSYVEGVATEPSCLPSEITDCSLVLLPKPGKTSKLPGDLRPLGIQDPTSKVVARIVRDQLATYVGAILDANPQYA